MLLAMTFLPFYYHSFTVSATLWLRVQTDLPLSCAVLQTLIERSKQETVRVPRIDPRGLPCVSVPVSVTGDGTAAALPQKFLTLSTSWTVCVRETF